ncbi:alpha/beta fold hydrolase [Kitasatospora aureofaciens]|uniref:alpha/beta fold hydrolase n=1 Tax=Kitasatospora aureofaciens TaxID=1894 RepID=UPI0033D68EE7
MATFILVPGAWHGAWAFEAVVPLLERAGHTVHALTLTGLWPEDDDATVATANLDTHADDVLRLLDRAHITEATLVGHSYGGMVIAAAADRAGGRVARLVHLDAYVPRDGESCWSSTSEGYREAFVAGAAGTGYAVQPSTGGDPRRRPHPLASLLQGIRLTGAFAQVPRREFVYCSGWEDKTPFADLRTRLRADPEWQVHDLPTVHNAMREDPEAVAALLLGDEQRPGAAWVFHGVPGLVSEHRGPRAGLALGASAPPPTRDLGPHPAALGPTGRRPDAIYHGGRGPERPHLPTAER